MSAGRCSRRRLSLCHESAWRVLWIGAVASPTRRARALYRDTDLELDVAYGYAPDATATGSYLGLFGWVPFRQTRAAVRMYTLLDLRGVIPTFIHVTRCLFRFIPLLCPSRRASEVPSFFAIRRNTHQSRRQIRLESICPISLDQNVRCSFR